MRNEGNRISLDNWVQLKISVRWQLRLMRFLLYKYHIFHCVQILTMTKLSNQISRQNIFDTRIAKLRSFLISSRFTMTLVCSGFLIKAGDKKTVPVKDVSSNVNVPCWMIPIPTSPICLEATIEMPCLSVHSARFTFSQVSYLKIKHSRTGLYQLPIYDWLSCDLLFSRWVQ